MKWLGFIGLVLTLFSACNFLEEDTLQQPVAKVFDKMLFSKDIEGIAPIGSSSDDSAHIVSQYVDQWVKRELLVKKAEIYLTDDQKDVEKELNDYRASLLIDRYLQQFTRQKLDTSVTMEEIEKFYNNHNADFKLANNVVRAVYIQLPLDAPMDQLDDLLDSNEKEDLVKLDDFCYSYAIKFKNYNHDWVSFGIVQLDIPMHIENPTDFLRRNKKVEKLDSISRHVVYFKEHRIEGDKTPIDFVKGNIKKILLTKRRSDLIKELKNNIYTDALDHQYFEIQKTQL